jgi:hypothetical protein
MTSRQLTCSLAAALAAAAISAPAALAMPDYSMTPPGADRIQDAAAPAPVQTPAPTVVEADDASGFDWSSAAVGAGVGAALLLLTGAGAMTARHGRVRTPDGGATG